MSMSMSPLQCHHPCTRFALLRGGSFYLTCLFQPNNKICQVLHTVGILVVHKKKKKKNVLHRTDAAAALRGIDPKDCTL